MSDLIYDISKYVWPALCTKYQPIVCCRDQKEINIKNDLRDYFDHSNVLNVLANVMELWIKQPYAISLPGCQYNKDVSDTSYE